MIMVHRTKQKFSSIIRRKLCIWGGRFHIKESGCFVVNLVDEKYKEIFNYLGSHSKRDEDKLAKMQVRLENGSKVNAPIIADCPVNIECTIVDSIVTGSHEMFIGKIEYVHACSDLLNEDGSIDFSRINFL